MIEQDTTNLRLPLLAAAQAQKHVTHNEALIALDALAQIALRSRTATEPPADLEPGDRFLVPVASGSGDGDMDEAWRGHGGEIAAWTSGGWRFHPVRAGFVAWIADEGTLVAHDGTAFVPVGGGEDVSAQRVGINATADDRNRLAVAAEGTLLTHDASGDHRLAINREAEAATASLVLQTGYSGRAEIGLTGQEGLSFKVSADGTNWRDALRTDPATGEVDMPHSQYASGAIVNLMKDGGRMGGAPDSGSTLVGPFRRPTWMGLSNGATFTEFARFHRNSSTYGGTGPALDPHVRQLAEIVYDGIARRYAMEFHVGEMVAGTGAAAITGPDGVRRATQLFTFGRFRPARATFSYYVKVLSGTVALMERNDARVSVDGADRPEQVLLDADDEWHHVVSHDGTEFASNLRFSTNSIRFFSESGARMLFALPALVPGFVHLPRTVGPVPTPDHW